MSLPPALAAAPPTPAPAAATAPAAASAQRDGSHDFDWDIGSWRTHQRRRLHPLTGSNTWVDYDGTDIVRKLWDGANTGMIEAQGPGGRLQIFTIRLYNPESHQWGIAFVNSAAGAMSPTLTGEFRNGRAEFYDQEPYQGRQILVRFAIADITANSCRFEQSFSADGGRTWEVNFVVTETRMAPPGAAAAAQKPPLSAKDTVVLANFENGTGDALFDGTLRQALALELEESPFVNVLADRRVQAALQAARVPSGRTLTAKAARRVCSRTGSKAVLRGAISRQAEGYRLDLLAVDCASGAELAHARSAATTRAGVLGALAQAASALRIQLGEPAASVQRYRAPAGTTTAALEALKSYSLGLATQREHGDDPSIPEFRHAIRLDPQLAVAYASLAAAYRNLRQPSLSLQFATRAYALRDRAGGREAFRIATVYFLATGQLDQEIRAYQQWSAVYPRDFLPINDLGNDYAAIGRNREALAEYQTALRLQPSSIGYTNVGGMEITLDRLADARATLEEAVTRRFDGLYIRQNLYWLGFLQRDDSLMRQQLAWAAGRAGSEDALLTEESDTDAYYGRLRTAREVTRRAVASAIHAGSKETAALWQVNAALRDAEAGDADLAHREAAAALELSSGRDVTVFAALTLARSGEPGPAQALVQTLASRYPTNTLLKRFWLPTVAAAIDIDRGRDRSAITALKIAAPCEQGTGGTFIAYLYPAYVRGDAYLHEHDGKAAAAEFRKLAGQPGIMINFITASLMYLQLGRAYGMAGEPAQARAAYHRFFTLWSGADAHVPVLDQARKEYPLISASAAG